MLPDREVGGGPDDSRDYPTMMSNHPFQGESNTGDSSGLLFSVYSKATEDEDKKMVEHWQKDADGILIFTGLFSAAVAALLAVTVLDLRPSSQDISAFYLGNIYQVLADPNVTRTSTSSPVVKPPSFSPPRYTVWVNSLWFLSLVMSLSCALWATSLQQWARRYLRRTQPARCSPETRARMRAFFAGGVDDMYIPWAVEGLPMLLHLSLFLFFGGVAIFLFNTNREVFGYVIWWIGLFSLVYGLITLLPTIRHDSPYHSPLSTPVWFLYSSLHYVIFKMLTFIILNGCCWSHRVFRRYKVSRHRYQRWMLGGVEKAAAETASERSSEIDVQVLDWTISALGDDDSLKSFFEAIPRSFNSKMLEHLKTDIPSTLRLKILSALRGFCVRTLSSNSISDSEKVHRLDISNNAIVQISETDNWLIRFLSHRLDVPQTVEMGHTLVRWFTNNGQDVPAITQHTIARILFNVRERNDSWVMLAARAFDLPERVFRDNIALGDDSVLLTILIHVTRQYLRSEHPNQVVWEPLSKLDIRNTLPNLQHDFCTLWNEVVQEARVQGPYSVPARILYGIRLPYIALHQGTGAAPTAFDASTDKCDDMLYQTSSYPFCNLASHHPDSPAHIPVALLTQRCNPLDGGYQASQQAEQVNNFTEPSSSSYPKTTGEIRAISHGPDITQPTNPIHSSSLTTGTLLTAVVSAALPDVTSTATIGALSAEPESSQILSYTPTPTSPASPPNTLSESYYAGVSADPSYFSSPSFSSSIPTSRPIGSATLPRLRARGLVNTKNICFVNAVLQLLVKSPPFWNLFRELDDLKRQRGTGVPETGCDATPLVDATVRFFKEFMLEESPSTQRHSQPAPCGAGTSRADEEKKNDNFFDSFEPTYLYDAMMGKMELKSLLDGQQQDAEEFLSLYLDALDKELLTLLPSISGPRSDNDSIKSPIAHIFGGKFRLPFRALKLPVPVTTEDWRSLHLDIQPDSVLTVEDALMHISQSQSVQVGSSGLSDSSQQMLIEALPPVLILHLKRFRYDGAAGGVIKIGKPVKYSSELEIPFDTMVPNAQRPSEPPHYRLYGVLYHHGESAGSGHYTVDVLHPNRDVYTGEDWLHIDDETVTPMRHEERGTECAADERSSLFVIVPHHALRLFAVGRSVVPQ